MMQPVVRMPDPRSRWRGAAVSAKPRLAAPIIAGMGRPSGYYSIAGLLVRTVPDDVTAVAARLSALPGVEVHHREDATGRLVITLETVDNDDEREGLERLRGQAGVVSAELVYHYVAPPGAADDPRPRAEA